MKAVALIVMLALGAPAAAQTSSTWPSERAPQPLRPKEVQFPPYEIKTLPNGLQVVAVSHHEQPIVSLRLLVKTGAVNDPQGKSGVASLVASVLDQGTTSLSAGEIADRIDFIGGALGVGASTELTSVQAVVMKDSFAVGLELVNDVVRNPAFAQEEIDRQKQQITSALQVNRQDPEYIAGTVFDRLVYGFHPYGLPGNGTPETLAAITRQDLQEYHRRYFVPNNMILAVVGDVLPQEAFAAVERVFGSLVRNDVPATRIAEPPPPTRRIVVIDKPDAVQTEIRVGMLAIPRKHPDYMAWDLAVKILGGEGANRLHQVLRSQRGLTYGASADTEARKQAGDFVADTDTRTDTTGQVLRLMVDEFSRLQRERVGQGELSGAQDYLAGSFPLTIETPNDIATQILNVMFYELPLSEVGTFRQRVLAVTPDDIQRVAREYIRPDRLSMVLVGNARQFVPQLTQMGFTGIEVIRVDELDLLSPTLKREARPPSLGYGGASPRSLGYGGANGASSPTSGGAGGFQRASFEQPAADPAAALLARVVQAKGGLDTLKRIKTVVADAQTTVRTQPVPMMSLTRTYVSYPDKFRVDAKVNGADVVQVFNAGSAWMRDPAGVHDAPPPMRADFAASVRRDIIPLLIDAAEGRLLVRLLPDDGSGASALKVLQLSSAEGGAVYLHIDSRMLIARQSYLPQGPDGKPVRAEERFSDYRAVEGVQIPFTASVYRDGVPVLERMLTRVVINGPIDDQLFTRPR